MITLRKIIGYEKEKLNKRELSKNVKQLLNMLDYPIIYADPMPLQFSNKNVNDKFTKKTGEL
jgi:hypothetical protein